MTLQDRYEGLLARIVQELRSLYGDRLVACAVFGSVGRGTQRDGSDIDLLVIATSLPKGRFARVDEFLPVENSLATELLPVSSEGGAILINPVFKTREEAVAGSPLFLDMVDDARLLFDPQGFLRARLDRLRDRLTELGARRVWLGNAWYWELKPDLRPGEVFSL